MKHEVDAPIGLLVVRVTSTDLSLGSAFEVINT